MASISFDGQSLMVDGRRIWLVSGSVHYARTPHQLWRRRLRAAREAGLNCIETYVFWNLHEPHRGTFNFEGDADLRRFVELIGEEGMYCILRPGPFIGAEWDFGGLPAWLTTIPHMQLREGTSRRHVDNPFLEMTARYFNALMGQVRDLQISEPGGGPIVLMQAENEWFCHNPEQSDAYLREIVRFLRESGCTVPITECNNLWQKIEGAISTWNANQHLAPDLRQLRVVQPRAPRLVSEYWPGWFDHWGAEHQTGVDADLNLYRLAQILASGAQYNLYMFHGGTNFAFWGGRSVASRDCFITTSYDYEAPLLEAGGRGPKYHAIKRLSTFASQFDHIFAHLDPDNFPAAIVPDESDHPLSVLYQRGAQGQVVFFLKAAGSRTREAPLLLPNGLTLPVPLGSDRVAWLLLEANLGVAELTYTNLRPWAFVGQKMLVLFGPAGAQGVVAINGSPLHVTVPKGRKPVIEHQEDLTVVVLNPQMVDEAYLRPDGLVLDACGFDDQGEPIPASRNSVTLVDLKGGVSTRTIDTQRKSPAPKLEGWEQADLNPLLEGSCEAFEATDGPATLEALGQPYGYGWYRLTLKAAGKWPKALAPQAGDRLHLFQGGKRTHLLGLGPGAEYEPAALELRETAVVLADNLGRFNFGWSLGEKKGLWGHLHAVTPVKLAKPRVVPGRAPDVFELGGCFIGMRAGDRPPADSLIWSIKLTRKPLVLDIQNLPVPAMVFLNDAPVAAYHPLYSAGILRQVIEPDEETAARKAELRLAFFERHDPKLNPGKFLKLYQSAENLTAKAEWAFARWTPPAADGFGPLKKASHALPRWYRARFKVNNVNDPLWLHPRGMSKGQIFLNGHNVGRYFVHTADGRKVTPQQFYYLPEPWLNVGEQNELLLFDEHGKNPAQCELVYDRMGPHRR